MKKMLHELTKKTTFKQFFCS